MSAELKALIRAAGGIVHSDGNIFFTSAAQFQAAAEAVRATPAPAAPGQEAAASVTNSTHD